MDLNDIQPSQEALHALETKANELCEKLNIQSYLEHTTYESFYVIKNRKRTGYDSDSLIFAINHGTKDFYRNECGIKELTIYQYHFNEEQHQMLKELEGVLRQIAVYDSVTHFLYTYEGDM